MIVYKAENLINGSTYIGMTKNDFKSRIKSHEYSAKNGSKTYFHSALRKYGFDNFKWSILEKCKSIEHMRFKESFYIGFYRAKEAIEDLTNYNLTCGGQGLYGLSQSIRDKKSKSMKGKNKGSNNGMYGRIENKNPSYGSGKKVICLND